MDLLTVPRALAAVEYKVLRYPSQVFATRVVAVRLPEGSGLRLAYERLFAALDSRVGALLADQELADRGRALSSRADVLGPAVTLAVRAAQRRERANAELRAQMAQMGKDTTQDRGGQR